MYLLSRLRILTVETVISLAWISSTAVGIEPASLSELVIDLPTLTVQDRESLPPPESWRYARIDGFEVLSNASDHAATRLLNDFQRFHQALVIAWPSVEMKTAVPASLILCGRGDKFAAFKPAKDTGADSGLVSLSLRSGEISAIVVDLETKTLNLATPDSFSPPSGSDGESGPVGPLEFSVDHYKQLYREYIHFILAQVEPRASAWLEEGLSQIFMRMEFTSKWIRVGKIEDPNAKSLLPGEIEDRDFNVMLAHRSLMPLSEMFGVAHDSAVALHPVGSAWAKQCYAFVHYCLYGNSGRLQKEFFTFIGRAAKETITEAMFKACFNRSSSSMLTELRGYIEFTSYRSTEFKANKGERFPEPPRVEFRDATPAEIGRIKGETLRLAGNQAAARDALIAPYIRGERDPQLLASLGLYESERGDETRARKFLEAATSAKVVRPRAYLTLARLRYREALTAPAGSDGKMSRDQVASVLRPLFMARGQPPSLAEVYEMIVATWAHSSVPPTRENLEVVIEGVRLFFRRPEFVYEASSLMAQYGFKTEAEALAEVGLKVATDENLKTRLNALKVSAVSEASPRNAVNPDSK